MGIHIPDLYKRLRADGFKPWLDEEDLVGGQDWDPEIRKAVQNSHLFIVCLSRTSAGKTLQPAATTRRAGSNSRKLGSPQFRSRFRRGLSAAVVA